VIWIQDYTGPGSEDRPCQLHFHRGSETLVIRIVQELARLCGPFIVMLNNETPRLVSGSST
jgi:hypothetical protein